MQHTADVNELKNKSKYLSLSSTFSSERSRSPSMRTSLRATFANDTNRGKVVAGYTRFISEFSSGFAGQR